MGLFDLCGELKVSGVLEAWWCRLARVGHFSFTVCRQEVRFLRTYWRHSKLKFPNPTHTCTRLLSITHMKIIDVLLTSKKHPCSKCASVETRRDFVVSLWRVAVRLRMGHVLCAHTDRHWHFFDCPGLSQTIGWCVRPTICRVF